MVHATRTYTRRHYRKDKPADEQVYNDLIGFIWLPDKTKLIYILCKYKLYEKLFRVVIKWLGRLLE